jgi:hypothetical protein
MDVGDYIDKRGLAVIFGAYGFHRPALGSAPALGALKTKLGALETENACHPFNNRPACCHEGA